MVSLGFNPRTHVGCDLGAYAGKGVGNGFNPRTHVGCDGDISAGLEAYSVSIHAPT